jgi:hypothetical protein
LQQAWFCIVENLVHLSHAQYLALSFGFKMRDGQFERLWEEDLAYIKTSCAKNFPWKSKLNLITVMEKLAIRRRPFITTDGKFGWGPTETEKSDQVFVLRATKIPFILRGQNVGICYRNYTGMKGSDLSYQLIGDCYFEGIMDGEWRRAVMTGTGHVPAPVSSAAWKACSDHLHFVMKETCTEFLIEALNTARLPSLPDELDWALYFRPRDYNLHHNFYAWIRKTFEKFFWNVEFPIEYGPTSSNSKQFTDRMQKLIRLYHYAMDLSNFVPVVLI